MLELGCGNSQLCEELYRDGITELTCIDLSPIAVEKMKQRLINKGYKGVREFLLVQVYAISLVALTYIWLL